MTAEQWSTVQDALHHLDLDERRADAFDALIESHDALSARVWQLESALRSAVAILDAEMGDWREVFHADACVIDAGARVEVTERD